MTDKFLNWTSPNFAQSIENAKRCFYIEQTDNRRGWQIYTNDLDVNEFEDNFHDSRRDTQDYAESQEIMLIAQDALDLAETMTDEDLLKELSDFRALSIGTVLVIGKGIIFKETQLPPDAEYTKIVLREQPQFKEVEGSDDGLDNPYTSIYLNEFELCVTCYGVIKAEAYRVSK